jgi:hypothetical protein
MGKANTVLATTIWDNAKSDLNAIDTADIRFNDQYYFLSDSFNAVVPESDTREIVDMETLALHELGHLLGLTHIAEDEERLSIMNPALFIGAGSGRAKLSRGDIERIQKVYGCAGSACNIDATYEEILSLPTGDDNLIGPSLSEK